MEDGGRDRFGDEHDARAEAVARLAQDAGADAAPVRGVGEHEEVDRGAAGHAAGLAHGAVEHGPDGVANADDGGAEEQLGLVDAPLGVRLVAGGVDGRLPVRLLPDEDRAVRRRVDRRGHQRTPVDGDDLRLAPVHGDRDAGAGSAEVDSDPQRHPHPLAISTLPDPTTLPPPAPCRKRSSHPGPTKPAGTTAQDPKRHRHDAEQSRRDEDQSRRSPRSSRSAAKRLRRHRPAALCWHSGQSEATTAPGRAPPRLPV